MKLRLITSFLLLSITAVYVFRIYTADPEFDEMLDDLLDNTVPQVTTESLAPEIESVILLDSRSREEFETSHLQGARWVGFQKFDVDAFENLDRDAPIVVYCSVGKRSELVGEQLKNAGFKNVKNLRGGIFQWANENRPIVDGNGPTRNVHPYDRKWGRWLAPHISKKM